MCGICGALDLEREVVDEGGTRAMLAAMHHRGPDAEGIYRAPGMIAGMRRLSVIDLAGGNQPIANEDGSVEVVFNGEIYNHRELREQLESKGHTFKTRSDTEVLVHLWEEFGEGMLEKLNGMFAFCLHDRKSRRTLIARDRLGIKPLFFARRDQALYFASEIGVLLQHPALKSEVVSERLIDLFCLQYVPAEQTPYRGVEKLLPGHLIEMHDGKVEIRRWWALPAVEADQSEGDRAQQSRELTELLESSVRYRTISDVPLGLFLSGGLDSSILCALLAQHAEGPIESFSVGFDDASAFDERRHARAVAAAFGAQHHERVVSAVEIAEQLPKLIRHMQLPITDPAILPTWTLAEFARQRVTVALSGEGADELFGGYRRYAYQHRYGWLGRLPGARLAEPFLPTRVAQALEALAERHPGRNHLVWASTVGLRLAAELFDAEALQRFAARATDAFGSHLASSSRVELEGQLRTDQAEWLPHNLLAKIDHATMAHSLEARVPFLDHRLVEWAAALPASSKIAGGTTKRILRETFGSRLPASIPARPKRGFDLPLSQWIRGPLRELATETIDSDAVDLWPELNRTRARKMLHAHLEGRQEYGLPLFLLVSMLTFLQSRQGGG